jgi:hypothetical protein
MVVHAVQQKSSKAVRHDLAIYTCALRAGLPEGTEKGDAYTLGYVEAVAIRR